MKAIRVHQFGGPVVLTLEGRADAKAFSARGGSAHSCGRRQSLCHLYAGGHVAVKPTLPYTPGSAGAGVIEARINEVTGKAEKSPSSRSRRFSVAPMMEWTDRHCRFFHRLLTHGTLLYTEMLTVGAVLHGDRARLLRYDAAEHPLALQLGRG